LKTIKNQFALIVGITLVLGLARVGAQAEDTNSGTVAPKAKAAHPDRPPRPDKQDGSGNGSGADVTELKDIIKNFQDQKKEFLKQQKEQQAELRGKVREELTSKSTAIGSVRQEAKDAIAEAKLQSREQARKLADEAKDAAKQHPRE